MKYAPDSARRMKLIVKILLLISSSMILVACEQNVVKPTSELSVTVNFSDTPILIGDVTADPPVLSTQLSTMPIPPKAPGSGIVDWKELPVVPDRISQRTLEIYKIGQELHNNPDAFSVMGDCDSSPSWFLGDFDRGSSYYSLGEYAELNLVIDAFQGSFERKSMAVRSGFNTASILSPLWADPESCKAGESPMECEVRLHHPSFVFILLGTNDAYNLDDFEISIRKVLDSLVEQGIVPILATKADNLEGGNIINATISMLASEYEIPLWNFWRSIQSLPNRGLQLDGAHLTWAHNYFDDPKVMENAWPWRNLTALKELDKVWRAVQESRY